MKLATDRPTYIFNHDGCDRVRMLADTDMTEQDAADILVKPLSGTQISVIDWCLLRTGEHNARLPRGVLFDARRPGEADTFREKHHLLSKVIAHYAAQPLDLLDIVIKHAHEAGMLVFGNLRVNYAGLEVCPGRDVMATTRRGNKVPRKDFRDETFHAHLAVLYTDLLEKGVDGLGLDFERKAPFFPDDATQEERFTATTSFLRRIRELTEQPILARVSHEREFGEPNGQDPEAWVREGLIGLVVPATHDHNPDALDWRFDRFVEAASSSPRPCRVLPQIWPVPVPWKDRKGDLHPPEKVLNRARFFLEQGAHGAYFFNFCCAEDGDRSRTSILPNYVETFRQLPKAGWARDGS